MLQNLIAYINELSGGNQFIGGVLLGAISGVILWFCKELPLKLWYFTKAQLITTISIDNTTYQKRVLYYELLKFVGERTTVNGTRHLSYDASSDWDNASNFISLGLGTHLIFYRGIPLLANRAQTKVGTEMFESITLTKFGRQHGLFYQLLKEFSPPRPDIRYIYTWKKDQWERTSVLDTGGGLDAIALDPDLRKRFETEFDNFHTKRDVHKRLGIAHKLSYVLHGLPGSGKTSLIRALAQQYNLNICILDVVGMTDAALLHAFSCVPNNTIVLAEDFDSARQLHARTEKTGKEDVLLSDMTMGTLKGMLNALDGIQALDNIIVMFTTNHLEKIDPALIRSARIDHVRQLPQPGIEAIKAHFLTLYPELANHPVQWGHIPGCIIHSIKQKALDDTDKACELINYYVRNPTEALKEQMGRLDELEELRKTQKELLKLNSMTIDPPVADETTDVPLPRN